MELNYLGLVAALTAFLSIWWGHVAVRKIEALSVRLWLPIILAFLLGVICEVIAARSEHISLSAVCGIAGVIFLWDAFEFFRQQKRVKGGHTPANPNSPRHVKILVEHPAATTLDWLDRNPRGKPYSPKELDALKACAK